MSKVITYTETEISAVASSIAASLKAGNVYTFVGPLAAGKTTLIRAIMRELGYTKNVSSPTFVLEHRYPVENQAFNEVIHLDLYRLTPADLAHFDWAEYTAQNVVTLIEWPQIAEGHLPKNADQFILEVVNDKTRRITLPNNFSG